MLFDATAAGAHPMILRRLADAIREQNWSTVFLEIAIVVVGIYLVGKLSSKCSNFMTTISFT